MIDLYQSQIKHNLSFLKKELLALKDANKRNSLLNKINATEDSANSLSTLSTTLQVWIISLALIEEVEYLKEELPDIFYNPIED